jgi:hypothetical protein
MMTKRVEDNVRNLWAAMATVAARKAVDKCRVNEFAEAEQIAAVAAKFMDRAGTRACERYYNHPSST